MIELLELKVPYDRDQNKELKKLIQKKLHLRDSREIQGIQIVRRSIDARKKPAIFFIYSCACQIDEKQETEFLKRNRNPKIRKYQPVHYQAPAVKQIPEIRPVVVGAGPAGLFAALILARAGLSPLLIERGKSIDKRTGDVEQFFQTGTLNPESNVQFGEGGAGAFSDGKLNTQVHDREGRNRFVLSTFAECGADPEILYDPKPHVGTDKLVSVVANIRKEIQRLGGQVSFETKFTGFHSDEKQRLQSISVQTPEGNREIPCTDLILAIGHSARDTFRMLYDTGLPMHSKQFAVGFRIEHPQEWLNLHQYGVLHRNLPTASYKLAANLKNGRGVYSFCMCPGGYVENSSSEEGELVVNGMSYSGRDSANCNSAIVVSVGAKEYDLNDPMGAVNYQRQLEKRAYQLGQGRIPQQLYSDFLHGQASSGYGDFPSVTRGKTAFANLRGIFSPEIEDSFIQGMERFNRKISGFTRPDAILSGVESRTSSPVRIDRKEDGMTGIAGIYPCGEGAGYAGGIMSAAMDGMKMAEKLIQRYQ